MHQIKKLQNWVPNESDSLERKIKPNEMKFNTGKHVILLLSTTSKGIKVANFHRVLSAWQTLFKVFNWYYPNYSSL